MNSLQPYRSNYSAEIMQRIANGNSYQSLKVTLNIDGILKHRNPEVIKKICEAVESGLPFILYADTDHHSVINPKTMTIYAYTGKIRASTVVSLNTEQFMNNVRLAYASHEHFYQNRSITDREHGHAEIPGDGGGKELQDAKDNGE